MARLADILARDEEGRDELFAALPTLAPSFRTEPGTAANRFVRELERIVVDPEADLSALVVGPAQGFVRPSLLVRDSTIEPPASGIWKDKLAAAMPILERAIAASGRIEFKSHGPWNWEGTGWLVREDIVATNRHVARRFAKESGDGGGFVFKRGLDQRDMKSRIDFREEVESDDAMEFAVTEVLHIDGGPDLALLRVERQNDHGDQLANWLELETEVREEADVATIGYPEERNPDVAPLTTAIFGYDLGVKALAPGKIVSHRGAEFAHDCSTLRGNSGSPVVSLETGRVLGLHYGGDVVSRENLAVAAQPIARVLERL